MNISSFGELFSGNIPANLKAYFSTFSAPTLLASLVLGLILAFFGYKLYRTSLAAVGALFFGASANLFYPTISNLMGDFSVEPLNMRFATVIIAALLGALVMRYVQKLALFLVGAIFGWSFGAVALYAISPMLSEIEFFKTPSGIYTVLSVCALLFAILTPLIFKLLFIFTTSVAGLTVCTVALALSLFNNVNYVLLAASAIAGLVLGIVAMMYQYREAEDY